MTLSRLGATMIRVGKLLYKPFAPDIIWQGLSDERVVTMTFDDGPCPPFTHRILEILERFGLKGTFFVIGESAARHPEIIKGIASAGHLLGNHSYTHPLSLAARSQGRIASELLSTSELIEKLTGRRPSFFRPPLGLVSPRLHSACSALGLRIMEVTVWPQDTLCHDPARLAKAMIQRIRPGAIFVLHDGHAHRQDPDNDASVETLARLIPEALARGYRFVRTDELMNAA